MGPALNIASSTSAYVLADRGTWLSFKNRGDLAVLVEGDTRLFNQYGVMVVNPAKHPQVKVAEAQKFVDWVISPAGQTDDRRLQDRRRAAVLPQRQPVTSRHERLFRSAAGWHATVLLAGCASSTKCPWPLRRQPARRRPCRCMRRAACARRSR